MEFYENKSVGTSVATPATSKVDVDLDILTNNNISQSPQKSNKENVNNSGGSGGTFSINNSTSGAKPTNKREAELRAEALRLYVEAREGKNVAGGSGLSLGEYIYEQTGWYYDDFRNSLVDHEAPVYLGTSTASERGNFFSKSHI